MNNNDEKSGSIPDKVGISWRPEIGAAILDHLTEIDVLEIVAENCMHLSRSDLRTFRSLGEQIGLYVHAMSLGVASTFEVSENHLSKVARVIESVAPEGWSEHLAFVRTDNAELGHLAAPPWSEEVVENTIRNVKRVTEVVGCKPHLENIATLYHPPGSTMDEAMWTSKIIHGSEAHFLIDLENIYANNRNFKGSAVTQLLKFPLSSVHCVHIAGGEERHDEHGTYFLDDHMHAVSDDVFLLLEELAAQVKNPLTVILERDGNFPDFQETRSELERARCALRRGRERQAI